MTEAEVPLRTGWEAGAAASDTLTRAFLLNSAESLASPVRDMGGRVLSNDMVIATDLGRQAAFFNSITLLQPLTTLDFDAFFAEIDQFYGFGATDGPAGEVMLWSAWPTPDLRPLGWQLAGHPPLHVLPAGTKAPQLPPDLEIREVANAADLQVFEETMVVGFPFEDQLPYSPGRLLDERVLADTRTRRWVGWAEGRPVAVSAAFVEAGVTNVEMVVTLPDARGKGYGQAVTWQAALTEPGQPALLLSSDPGRPVYDRMGFLPLYRFTLWYRSRR